MISLFSQASLKADDKQAIRFLGWRQVSSIVSDACTAPRFCRARPAPRDLFGTMEVGFKLRRTCISFPATSSPHLLILIYNPASLPLRIYTCNIRVPEVII